MVYLANYQLTSLVDRQENTPTENIELTDDAQMKLGDNWTTNRDTSPAKTT